MSVHSELNWNLAGLFFCGEGKTGEPGEKALGARRESTTDYTDIGRQERESNLVHISGGRALSPLRHPCFIVPAVNLVLFLCLALQKQSKKEDNMLKRSKLTL